MPLNGLKLVSITILLILQPPLDLAITITTHSGNNLNKYNKNGSAFLNKKNPLWILDDPKSKIEQENLIYSTSKPYFYKRFPRKEILSTNTYQKPQMLVSGTITMREMPIRPKGRHRRRQFHGNFAKRIMSRNSAAAYGAQKLPHQIKLPSHYMQMPAPENPTKRRIKQHISKKKTPHSSLESARSMPIFDSLPGDDMELEAMPVFVYNSPRGQMLWNTVMSVEKYHMQEPVPGEVLYPPIAPMFRPKPIIENLRLTTSGTSGTGRSMNITLIPFYAHEALGMPFTTKVEQQRIEEFDYVLTTSTTTSTTETPVTTTKSNKVTNAPAIVYATSVITSPRTSQPTKKRRSKKVKKYVAYRSPDEVHWQPMAPIVQMQQASTTTPFPPTLIAPFLNHRFDAQPAEEHTTPMPMQGLNLTYEDDEDRLHIVYVDDDADITPKKATFHPKRIPLPYYSSRFARERSETGKGYYAYPVFTLSKLLKTNAERRLGQHLNVQYARRMQYKRKRAELMAKNKKNMWIKLNPKYKRNSSSYSSASTNTIDNTNNYHRLSTKYLQQTGRMLHDTSTSEVTAPTAVAEAAPTPVENASLSTTGEMHSS